MWDFEISMAELLDGVAVSSDGFMQRSITVIATSATNSSCWLFDVPLRIVMTL